MKIKRIIKTLEELRATPGVKERHGAFTKDGEIFSSLMFDYVGDNLIGGISCGGYITHWGLHFTRWMWKEVEGSPAEGLEFPCEMMVWDDVEEYPVKTEVHAYIPTLDYPWVNKNSTCFKHAKPIPEFKPRYVWVKHTEKGAWCVAEEIRSGVFYLTDDVRDYNTEDFYKIGPEATPPDL